MLLLFTISDLTIDTHRTAAHMKSHAYQWPLFLAMYYRFCVLNVTQRIHNTSRHNNVNIELFIWEHGLMLVQIQ